MKKNKQPYYNILKQIGIVLKTLQKRKTVFAKICSFQGSNCTFS